MGAGAVCGAFFKTISRNPWAWGNLFCSKFLPLNYLIAPRRGGLGVAALVSVRPCGQPHAHNSETREHHHGAQHNRAARSLLLRALRGPSCPSAHAQVPWGICAMRFCYFQHGVNTDRTIPCWLACLHSHSVADIGWLSSHTASAHRGQPLRLGLQLVVAGAPQPSHPPPLATGLGAFAKCVPHCWRVPQENLSLCCRCSRARGAGVCSDSGRAGAALRYRMVAQLARPPPRPSLVVPPPYCVPPRLLLIRTPSGDVLPCCIF